LVGADYGNLQDAHPFTSYTEFIGRAQIVPAIGTVLAAELPNLVVVRAASVADLPVTLRHRLTLQAHRSEQDRAIDVSDLRFELDLSAVAGRRLGLTYAPATDDDAAVLAAFLNDAQVIGLPAYLVQLRIRLDGVEVARGPAITMGQPHLWTTILDEPGGGPSTQTFRGTVGDELVFGVNGNGITHDLVRDRMDRVTSDSAEENLFTVALTYWTLSDLLADGIASAHEAVVQRLPSIGVFVAPFRVDNVWGSPATDSSPPGAWT
jgi:hypothetical protein